MKHGLPSPPQNRLIVQTIGVPMLAGRSKGRGSCSCWDCGCDGQEATRLPYRATTWTPWGLMVWYLPGSSHLGNYAEIVSTVLTGPSKTTTVSSLILYQLQLSLNQWCDGKLLPLPRLIFSTFYQRRPTQRRHIPQFLQRSLTQAGSDKAAINRDPQEADKEG